MVTAEDILHQKDRDMVSIPVDVTIIEALQTMSENKIGSVLAIQDDAIVGIWTERDLLHDTLTPGFDPKTAKVADYMTTELHSAPHTDTIYGLLDTFLGKRFRHLLVEKDGEYIGLISIGDVVRACLEDKTKELKDLNAIVSWEYYEDWKWKHKHKHSHR